MTKLLGISCVLVWIVAPAGPVSAFSQPNGALGSFGGTGWSPCHGGEPSPALEVILDGPDSIPPGGVARFTAFINPLGVGGGIDIAIDQAARSLGWMLDTDDPGLGPVTSGNLIQVDGLAPASSARSESRQKRLRFAQVRRVEALFERVVERREPSARRLPISALRE